ncbi:hypothetical protein [Hyphomicrobium sp.]|jgi:hypothetical protein|uniref:hypothetical protein n=1 Tax=Hyphomicrobium sp. TaxID=82 RepID=UPI0035624A92
MSLPRRAILIAVVCLAPFNAWATDAKIDADTCTTLRLEQIKFRQSGILDDMSKGAVWAKANLSADRLREIEHYLQLDEQVQFGCRDAKLSAEAKRASEAAARIELNSDADPTAPIANDPPKPGAAAKAPDGKKAVPEKAAKKKTKPSDPKAHNKKSAKVSKADESSAEPAPQPPVVMQSQDEQSSAVAAGHSEESAAPSLPAFGLGFGETTVLPHAGP